LKAAYKEKNIVWLLFIAVGIILALFTCYSTVNDSYPYYFIWDMDHVTALDVISLQSGLLPDQICHPGFGMYFPLFVSTKIGNLFGVISALNFEDLAAAIDPIGSYAELTDFIRAHSPFLAICIIMTLTAALCFLFDIPGWIVILIILALGTQESLIYHSSMIRTDFYSVFWWAAAITTLTATSRIQKRKNTSFFTGGILLGLSFLTKMQSLLLLPLAIIICLLGLSFSENNGESYMPAFTRRSANLTAAISLVNFFVFILLASAANLVDIPHGIPTWAKAFGLTPIFFLFGVFFLSLFTYQLINCFSGKFTAYSFQLSSFLTAVTSGFLFSFALHFAIYADAGISLKYMLLDFKMIFLRDSKLFDIRNITLYFKDFISFVSYNPTPFIVNAGFLTMLVAGFRLKLLHLTSRQILLCLLAAMIVYFNIFIATRFILRDILWKEIPLNFLSIIFFAVTMTRAIKYKKIIKWVGAGSVFLLLTANCIHSSQMPGRIDANYNRYGWDKTKYFGGIFGGNHRKYTELIKSRYTPSSAWFASTRAAEHDRVKNTVEFIFQNQIITYKNIGFVFEGISALTSDLDYRIARVPDELRGAILYDATNAAIDQGRFLKQRTVREQSEYLDKFKSGSKNSIAVLPRTDLKVFMFIESGSDLSLLNEYVKKSPYKITIQKTGKSVEFEGYEIKTYCEIDTENMQTLFFFVIENI
jgi:hypothetical protein